MLKHVDVFSIISCHSLDLADGAAIVCEAVGRIFDNLDLAGAGPIGFEAFGRIFNFRTLLATISTWLTQRRRVWKHSDAF